MDKFPQEVKTKYKNLAHATGGSCILLGDSFSSNVNQNKSEVNTFLNILEASTKGNTNITEKRKNDYLLQSKKGQVEKFEWLKLLPNPNPNTKE